MARTRPVWGSFVQLKLNVTVPFRGLDAAAWARTGSADGERISVRALGHIVAGHELHHLPDLRSYHAGAE